MINHSRNYKSVSALPFVLKGYEQVIFGQASNYFKSFSRKFCVNFEKPRLYLNY